MSHIAYLRVSTDAQNLARQEDYAERIQADKVFREKLSGKNANRPELNRMLDYVREGDTLYVESISRLARSVRDLLAIVDTLQKKGCAFVSDKEQIDTSTPQGRFVLTIFAALAELERETTAQRREEGMRSALARGVKVGRPRVELPDDASRCFAAILQGAMTHKQAMDKLELKPSNYYKHYAAWKKEKE